MKKYLLLPLLVLFLNIGCGSDDSVTTTPPPSAPLAAATMLNVAYGPDAQQTMDVYLPAGRTENTKVVVLIHGGSWVAGSKEDMSFMVPTLQSQFPDHAIVNINYRLASAESPVHPKQINDIQRMLDFVEESNYQLSDDYAFIGVSAGAHLSMLYSYKHDTEHDVKAVVDIVGPADFTDPAYTVHPLYEQSAMVLVGTTTPTEEQILEINPVSHITAQSPPTLSFYGGQDFLIPSSQGPLLKEKLDAAGVYNEFNFYPEGGHADWNAQIMQEVFAKTIQFLNTHFD
jgi:acetyl esterase/lipase